MWVVQPFGLGRGDTAGGDLGTRPVNSSLAEEPCEQSLQQSLAFRVHRGEFDTHLLTRHGVPDNGLGHDHPSGYFKNKGQVGAYTHGDGPAEGQASDA
jgi:hypothetical protein